MKSSSYESFRKSLRIDAEYWDFETQEELRVLMTNAGYRSKKEEGVLYHNRVTDKQLDFAWGVLEGVSVQKIIDSYTVHTYHKQIIKRANKSQTVKGKTYRKGQFLPKDE